MALDGMLDAIDGVCTGYDDNKLAKGESARGREGKSCVTCISNAHAEDLKRKGAK